MKTKYTLFIVLVIFPLVTYAQNPVEVARNYIERNKNSANLVNVQQLEFQLLSDYKAPETSYHYVYFAQDINGIGIYNAIYNVVVDDKNNVVNSTHSFSNFTGNAETVNLSNVISANDALASAFNLAERPYESQKIIMVDGVKHPDGILSKMRFIDSYNPNDTITVKLEWLPLEYVQEPSPIKKSLLLTWSVALEGKTNNNHWLMHFHAASGQLLQKQDLVIHCSFGESHEQHAKHSKSIFENEKEVNTSFAPNSYNVLDIPIESPIHGSRSIVTSPYTRFLPSGAGPGVTNGWHNDGSSDYIITRGNNVWASEDRNADNIAGFSPDSPSLDFNFPFTHGLNTAAGNQSAAITNLFYWNNLLHDILYKYGFDEVSGNFQNNNMGRGGAGGDYVRADAQDGLGTNNANFFTPIDGGVPRMQMFLWSPNSIYQPDSDFDNGIIAHEYGHGWSTRLTSGPLSNTCLFHTESAGEGWSDYLGLMLTTDWSSLTPTLASANIPRGIGTYALTQATSGPGIRPYRYSYDMANINSAITYGKVANSSFSQPHGIGSIWATILWDLTWEMILQDGQIENNIWNTTNMTGNVAALKLVNEGLRLQKCSPSFVDARDAIFEADSLHFAGRYRCSIDKIFTRRGLGFYASSGSSTNDRIVTEDFTPILGPKLSSPLQNSTCSDLPFNYTLSSSTPGVTFSWTRPVVAGISNPSGSGTGSTINETLINTTPLPIEVVYLITMSPNECLGSSFQHKVKVTVTAGNTPELSDFSVCQNGTIPAGQGLKGTSIAFPTPNSINENIILNASSPIFNRPSSSSSYYYKITSFTCNYPGSYLIELNKVSSNADPFLYVYSSFNPSSPSSNLIISDDDGGGLPNARLVMNLTMGQTIYIVSTDYYTTVSGTYNLKVNPYFTPEVTAHKWYLNSFSSTALSTDLVFNPLQTPGSGVTNTSSPGIHNFYYSRRADGLCRIPVSFVIDSTSIGGNIAPVSLRCPGEGTTLSLSGHVGNVTEWQRSTDNFATFTAIPSTGSSLAIASVTGATQFRAVVKSGRCNSVFSAPVSVTDAQNNLHLISNYTSDIKTEKAIQHITAVNKITTPAKITYSAGKSIVLQPGFEAGNASVFKAEIGGCN
jgi:hypothetical protein